MLRADPLVDFAGSSPVLRRHIPDGQGENAQLAPVMPGRSSCGTEYC
jgi:hypothetical protein